LSEDYPLLIKWYIFKGMLRHPSFIHIIRNL
jgi:hypothetical protein